jgi:3-methyladenine DNA glycosylase AlkD
MENQNHDNVVKYSRYFKDAPDSYGLTSPQMKEKTKQLLKSGNLTLNIVLEAIPELFESQKYEEILFGMLLVDGFPKQFTPALFSEISHWFSYGITNWAHADTLGMYILPKFFKQNLITDSDFHDWLLSPHRFQRRCVPVTFIKTLKARNTFQSLFTFLEPLMIDPARVVHQGMGWFLRSCWKLKPEETEYFLLTWKDRSPRLIIQYATEKMNPSEKIRFKKG